MPSWLWILLAFLLGSLPLSVWLGKIALHTDIRHFGDGNPGAANVWRAGGKWWGIVAVLLDFLKGAIPVGLANYVVALEGWALVAVALAPILGHAFSPFLGFRGGKSLAVTFGIWTGLTLWVVPTVMGLAFGFWLAILVVEGWAVLLGMLTLLVFLLVAMPDPVLLAVWFGSLLILVWKHRGDYHRSPQLSKGVLRRLFRKA
jgi:glycerol-3-phosphate acyltransferase PlsY